MPDDKCPAGRVDKERRLAGHADVDLRAAERLYLVQRGRSDDDLESYLGIHVVVTGVDDEPAPVDPRAYERNEVIVTSHLDDGLAHGRVDDDLSVHGADLERIEPRDESRLGSGDAT